MIYLLRDKWTNKQNDVDVIDADDINDIANAVIAIENGIETYDKEIMALLGSDEP